MTRPSQNTSPIKWAVVLILVALHPVLLYLLVPVVGERINLAIVIAPVVTTWLFGWRAAAAVILANAVSTAVVFSLLMEMSSKEGLPKSIATVLILGVLCFVVDRVKRYIDKGKSMAKELEELRRSRPQ